MVCQVLKRFGGRAAVWERVLLEGVLVDVGVGARVLLDGVHPLVVLLGGRGRGGRGRQGLQRLMPARGRRRGERLDDADGGGVQAAEHLHVTGAKQGLCVLLILLVQFLVHTVHKDAERNPKQ